MKITTAIVLDTRRQKLNGTYPVKLRITQDRKQKYYSIEKLAPKDSDFMVPIFSLTEKEFDQAMGEKPRGIHKDRALQLSAIETRSREIIDSIPSFTWEIFERHLKAPGSDVKSVFAAYQIKITQLLNDGDAGNATAYRCSFNSLKSICSKSDLLFNDVDVDFLKWYEKKMVERGNSLNTVSMYVRCLRAIYNDAIKSGNANRELYPFGIEKDGKYEVPQVKRKKKALSKSDIQKLYLYEAPPGSTEQWALDLWMFSYLCNGMNMRDIARLKFKNISDGKITFIRKKTIKTSRSEIKEIVAVINLRVQQILNRWSVKNTSPEGYVFGILKHGLSPVQELKKTQQATKLVNKYVKRISKQLGIEGITTTLIARHSFATVLKRSGTSIEFISESLGHGNLKTTEIYLGSFEDETREVNANKLIDFTTNQLPEPVEQLN